MSVPRYGTGPHSSSSSLSYLAGNGQMGREAHTTMVAACQHMSHCCRNSSCSLTVLVLTGFASCCQHRLFMPASLACYLYLAAYLPDVSLLSPECACRICRAGSMTESAVDSKGGHGSSQLCWRRGCVMLTGGCVPKFAWPDSTHHRMQALIPGQWPRPATCFPSVHC